MADKMEYWDVFDEKKRPTGRIMEKNDGSLGRGEYHISVLGVLRRSDGRFLITRRREDKAWAPGWWEVPGGGVMAGESSEEAVRREVLEETGLDILGCSGGFLFDYHRENPGEGDNYFVDIYLYHMDFDERDVRLQESEATDFRAATHEEIRVLAREGIFLHYESIKRAFE